MRRLVLRRELLLVLAVAAFAAAAYLILVAVDVDRWRSTIAADDVRYRVTSAEGLWSPETVAPLDPAGRLLGVDDDVAFRQALGVLRASSLDDPTISDPNLAVKRTDAAERLESVVVHDPDPERRSRASNLLGVLGMTLFNASPSGGNMGDRSELLLSAIAGFEQAIAIDPGNEDAKYNLQVILLRGQGLLPTEAAAGRNPTPGGRGAKGAGAGEPGSGY